MIAIIDSGVANLTSVQAAFERMGRSAVVSKDPVVINSAERVILPGVGAAPAAMAQLESRGLVETIRGLTQPVLGICLGMQLLFNSSEEGAEKGIATKCLGLVPGMVEKLKEDETTILPHMGWNTLEIAATDHPLLRGLEEGAYMYFVHSFAAPPSALTLAQCTYGAPFTAMVGYRNFYGCQFHPERSGEAGQRILRNFVEMKE